MLIEDSIKLDFKDVLIRPKRSNLNSRSEVNLNRVIKFKHSNYKWEGIPIMVANIDTVGTFEMPEECYKYKLFTCIHKYYTYEDWCSFVNKYIMMKLILILQIINIQIQIKLIIYLIIYLLHLVLVKVIYTKCMK